MVPRTRIKVCGITEQSEAEALARLGVDALGFIFYKESPRYIEPEAARKIISSLPPFVDTQGVFVNEDPDLVNDIAQYCSLSFVQLHGSEPVKYCQAINTPIIKAFQIKGRESLDEIKPFEELTKGFLLDTYHPELAGGTGEKFDWQLLADYLIPKPFILAGGLNAGNVEEAVRITRPWAVDVNSGVESSAGHKDISLVAEVMAAVRRADNSKK
ncbi:Phosphoribosylanthranilate isomerase [hydrothermal vent metagenome]|uniref:phosphoribosylanthranilate isomerase n=1 Tax=hydrothermal vent metagenome TaxID=652676 RepID=A0A3B0VT52_9ZZZZ